LLEGVLAAGQARSIDTLRYWNPLPNKVQLRFAFYPDNGEGAAIRPRLGQKEKLEVFAGVDGVDGVDDEVHL
jgi:hypothetical protein